MIALALLFASLPAAAQSHRVPFTMKDNMIFVAAKVNGYPAVLEIDTGATSSVFPEKLLTVHNAKETEVKTAGGMVKARVGDARIELDGLSFQLTATYLPNHYVGEGLIGIDVLRQFEQVIFDFKAKEIEFVPYH